VKDKRITQKEKGDLTLEIGKRADAFHWRHDASRRELQVSGKRQGSAWFCGVAKGEQENFAMRQRYATATAEPERNTKKIVCL